MKHIELHELMGGQPLLVGVDHITSVRHEERREFVGGPPIPVIAVEYLGNSGYQTRQTWVRETFDEVKRLISVSHGG